MATLAYTLVVLVMLPFCALAVGSIVVWAVDTVRGLLPDRSPGGPDRPQR